MAAGTRRWSGREKGWPARQRNSSLLVSARRLQALVTRCARVTGPFDPRECPSVDTVEPKPHPAAPGVGSHVRHSHIGHTYLDGLVGTSGRIEPDEGTRADLIEPYEPVRADSEVIDERSLVCRWEFPSLDGGTVKDANDAAVARVVPHSARGVGRHGIQACIVRRQAPPKPLPRGSVTRLSPRVGDSQPAIGWNGGHRKTNQWVGRRQPDPDGAVRCHDKEVPMLVDPRIAGVGVERPPVSGCRITREPDLACVYEHRVYKSNLPGEGELPTATGHRVDAANAAVLRSRIPDDACRIHGDAMGIGAC